MIDTVNIVELASYWLLHSELRYVVPPYCDCLSVYVLSFVATEVESTCLVEFCDLMLYCCDLHLQFELCVNEH